MALGQLLGYLLRVRGQIATAHHKDNLEGDRNGVIWAGEAQEFWVLRDLGDSNWSILMCGAQRTVGIWWI